MQYKLCVHHLLESLRFKVELPMLLEMDNSETVDIKDNGSVGGHTCHVYVLNYFLHELTDLGLLIIKHIPGNMKDADFLL